ncbi:MAG TPA: hypothetical protein VIA06_20645 [Candidatus Dormibacteraeota bacterium]|nr:hypothetical protein [Candidatus Dormibacteraeota bacterium]
MNEVLRPVRTTTPFQKILIGGSGTWVSLILLANLWVLVGRPIENQTGSLLLGMGGATVALALILLVLAAIVLGVYGLICGLATRA